MRDNNLNDDEDDDNHKNDEIFLLFSVCGIYQLFPQSDDLF